MGRRLGSLKDHCEHSKPPCPACAKRRRQEREEARRYRQRTRNPNAEPWFRPIKREEVFAAADALLKEDGKRPTRERVANRIGRTGHSGLVIQDFLQEWWKTIPDRLEPADLRQKLAELLHELSLCHITHLEPLRQARLDTLIQELKALSEARVDQAPF